MKGVLTKGHEFVRASKQILLGNYSNVFITLLVTILLARMISPSDFGRMAMLMVVINFINVIGNSGVSVAIIQFGDKLNKNSLSGLFLILLLVSTTLTIMLYYNSNLIIYLFKDEGLNLYLKYISPFIILSLLSGGFRAVLVSFKDFYKVSYYSVVATLCSGAIGLALAFLNFGIISLILKSLVYQLLLVVFYAYQSRLRFGKRLSFKFPKEMYSLWTSGFYSQFVSYLMRNLDTILVGKFLGDSALGLYDVAFKLVRQPVSSLAKVFTPVIQPLFKAYDQESLFQAYSRFARIIALVGFTLSVLLVFWGRNIFLLIYGSKWSDGASLFQIMSLTVLLHLLLSGVGGVMLSQGYHRILSRSMSYSFISTLGFMLYAVILGDLNIVAWSYVLSILVNFGQSFFLLFKHVFARLTFRTFHRKFIFDLVIAYLLLFGSYFLMINIFNDLFSENSINIVFTFMGICTLIFFLFKYQALKEFRYILKKF